MTDRQKIWDRRWRWCQHLPVGENLKTEVPPWVSPHYYPTDQFDGLARLAQWRSDGAAMAQHWAPGKFALDHTHSFRQVWLAFSGELLRFTSNFHPLQNKYLLLENSESSKCPNDFPLLTQRRSRYSSTLPTQRSACFNASCYGRGSWPSPFNCAIDHKCY